MMNMLQKKHREKNMRESLLKTEAKYLKDED